MEIINRGSKPGGSTRAQIKSCWNPTAGAGLIISVGFDVLSGSFLRKLLTDLSIYKFDIAYTL